MDPSAFAMPSMGPPQLSHHQHNQPLAFFGPYVPHGPGLLQPPPDYGAHAFPDHFLPDEPEAIETKKRRIARACDMCRKKKIKCDGKLPACTHCLNYKTSCVFTHVEKKRAPPKGAKYIEGLENRLGRMEHLLRLSGLLEEDEIDLGALEKKLMEKSGLASSSQAPGSPPLLDALGTPAHDTSFSSPENSQTPYSFDGDKPDRQDKHGNLKPAHARSGDCREAEEVETLSEMMCSLVTNKSGESRYTGSSSGFSIFSPKGIQWINSKTGDDSFRRMISHVSEDDHKWTSWKPEVFGQLFQRPVFRPLPPKEEALSLLDDYFTNFNCIVPLFYQPTFLHLVERQYSMDPTVDPYPSTGWWASLNVTLALAHRIRVMSGVDPAEEDEKGWAYLKNAMACFSELTMRSTDLLGVQALLGMALFLRGTPNPQPTYALIAAAIRLSHGIGLHKRGTGFNLNPVEIEQRKRVFWIAYMLDKDLCLQSGQPPMQDDNDVSVELPEVDADDSLGSFLVPDGGDGKSASKKMSVFRLLCEFSLIESNVYKRLYSAKASRQSDGELLNTIGELDRQLEEWKDGIPIEFRPEHPIQTSHPPLMLHLVTLHFAYFNCLTTIHRMSIQHGMWTSRLADYAAKGLNVRPLNPRIFSSSALCTSAARASIALLQYMPQGDFPCVWMILYFPVAALVTLFANILQNPLDTEAKNDVMLMNLVVNFLSTLGPEVQAGGVHRTLTVCSEFCRVADIVIDRAEADHPARRKRKIPDNLPPKLKPKPTPPADHLSPAPAWASPSPYAHQGSSPSLDSIAWTSPLDHQHRNPASYEAPEYHAHYGLMDVPGVQGHAFGAGAGVEGLQQPLLPPDLFALPVSLDWTWAEMSGGAYPSVENGSLGFSDPNQAQ